MDTVCTYVPRETVERGLAALGGSHVDLEVGLATLLRHAGLAGRVDVTGTDVAFYGGAQPAADMLLHAGSRPVVRAAPEPVQALHGLTEASTGWTVLGAALVGAGLVLGPRAVRAAQDAFKRRNKASRKRRKR